MVEHEIHLTEARFIGDGAEGWPLLPEVQVDVFFLHQDFTRCILTYQNLLFFFSCPTYEASQIFIHYLHEEIYHISLTISSQPSPEKRARKMNEHYIRQTERKPPRKRSSWKNDSKYQLTARRMVASINSLPQTRGSAVCELIRICFEENWERKRSNCGNRKGILKKVFHNYELKKKFYAKKKNQLKFRFWDTFYQ